MPIEPTVVRVESISTSSSKTCPSGVSTSTRNGVRAIRASDRADRRSPARRAGGGPSPRLLGGLDDVVDGALQQERGLRDVVVLALEDLLEAPDRLGDRHVDAGGPGELLGDVERLREEALDAARAADDELVLVGELVDAEDRDDV